MYVHRTPRSRVHPVALLVNAGTQSHRPISPMPGLASIANKSKWSAPAALRKTGWLAQRRSSMCPVHARESVLRQAQEILQWFLERDMTD